MIAILEVEAGEVVTRRLEHANGEARAFYAGLAKLSLIGIEATGYTQWFERMVAELGHELWVGDPAEIRARAVRRQKTDTRDAEHLLELLLSKKFPRVWVPTAAERDLRQPLKHRDKLVKMQTYQRLKFRRGWAVASVALARHLAVRLYWALRQAGTTPPAGSHA